MENGSKREKSFSDKIAEVEQDYQIGVRLICGSVGIIFTVLAAAGYDYYANSHLIAKIPKTKYQSVLIKTGVASTADFANAAQSAVDRKTQELYEANRDLIEGVLGKNVTDAPPAP